MPQSDAASPAGDSVSEPVDAMVAMRGVRKTYGSAEILRSIDLRVGRGEIAAVIGPSGAGKSTLSRLLGLLERPTSGSITIDGHDVTALSESGLRAARREIGTIFQASSLLHRRTARENVALPLEYARVNRHDRRRRVDELLERVGLSHRADAYPAQLSGGERQRVGIARALALGPSLLLSDESTSGLDPATTRTVLALLRELRDDLGLTIVLITHEMEVVRATADTATLLRGGAVVESGPVGELIARPRSRLGVELLPDRHHIESDPDEVVWRVTYTGAQPSLDWLGRLSAENGLDVRLLGGTVESIAGRPAGRVTIATRDDDELPRFLAQLGLHAERVEESAVAPPGEWSGAQRTGVVA